MLMSLPSAIRLTTSCLLGCSNDTLRSTGLVDTRCINSTSQKTNNSMTKYPTNCNDDHRRRELLFLIENETRAKAIKTTTKDAVSQTTIAEPRIPRTTEGSLSSIRIDLRHIYSIENIKERVLENFRGKFGIPQNRLDENISMEKFSFRRTD